MVYSTVPLLLSGFALFEFQVVFKTVENYGLLSMTINQYIKALFSKMVWNIIDWYVVVP